MGQSLEVKCRSCGTTLRIPANDKRSVRTCLSCGEDNVVAPAAGRSQATGGGSRRGDLLYHLLAALSLLAIAAGIMWYRRPITERRPPIPSQPTGPTRGIDEAGLARALVTLLDRARYARQTNDIIHTDLEVSRRELSSTDANVPIEEAITRKRANISIARQEADKAAHIVADAAIVDDEILAKMLGRIEQDYSDPPTINFLHGIDHAAGGKAKTADEIAKVIMDLWDRAAS